MRDYGKVSPQFWIGRTGKVLRGNPDAQVLALYLMTSPHATMIGVYHCPVAYMAHETGLSVEGASKALQRLIEVDFCTYDTENEYVFVHQFALHQVGADLKADDKRCKGIDNELAKVPKGQCWQAFRARYAVPYHLPLDAEAASPSEAPSKPLRSQKQEQEQKQKEGDAAPSFVLPDWIPAEPWDGYVEMRKRIRKPMTDRARKLVVNELQRLMAKGHDLSAVLDNSTRNNWVDVYEPKGAPAGVKQERFV